MQAITQVTPKQTKKKGVNIDLYANDETLRGAQEMLNIIALSLQMDPDAYKLRSRVREIAELRFLAALMLRQNLPSVTLMQIAYLFGGQDHSSVINGIQKAYNMLYTGDAAFTQKYDTAVAAVALWLNRHAA